MLSFEKAGKGVDMALRKMLSSRAKGPAAKAYRMLEYFLGFRDQELSVQKNASGKRFRPALSLYIAEAYGAKKKAFSAALAIELFHNFTLIHDDIVDHDEMRRGRPTVWKLFGIDNAINSGDILSLIVSEVCMQAREEAGNKITEVLFKGFREVCEGQYLDFEIAERPLDDISMQDYMVMNRKKTAALVGLAAETAGIAARKSSSEIRKLRTFGESLGVAYQIADDYRSVWSGTDETGKDAYGDIRQRKRAFPVIAAYDHASESERRALRYSYSLPRQLTTGEVREVLPIFERARETVRSEILTHTAAAKYALAQTSLPIPGKRELSDKVEELTRVA